MNKITLIKSSSQVPEKLESNCIVMNGTSKTITLNKIVPSIDTKTRVLNVTENGEYNVKASDKGFDAMKSVQVNVSVPVETYFTRFDGIKQVTSASTSIDDMKAALAQLRDFAEHCNCIGALLTVKNNGSTYTYTIWNGNPDNPNYYWDPFTCDSEWPADYFSYGDGNTPIAACGGPGLWVLNMDYATNNVCASSDTTLYELFIGQTVKGNGWNNTCCIFENFYNEIHNYDCIWNNICSSGYADGIPGWDVDDNALLRYGNVYVPSADEMRIIWKNCTYVTNSFPDRPTIDNYTNLGSFIYDNSTKWTSSQDAENNVRALYINDYGRLYEDSKSEIKNCIYAIKF